MDSALKYHQDFDARGMALKYYHALRKTQGAGRVLDIGCSTGALLALLKERGQEALGVEIDADAAAAGRERGLNVLTGSIADPNIQGELLARGPFDAVLCMDVLEHLPEPWMVLQEIRPLFAPDGFMFCTLPNVAFWRVRWGLMKGRFDYALEGILDRNHLRFFTVEGARALFKISGWEVAAMVPTSAELPLLGKKDTMFAVRTARHWPSFLAEVCAWELRPVRRML
jgi:2-polyprenyl-3-methyl-5-hydroxy-6-metoxy-1,4-benzoquinol methylase